jgi:hypothetical protein
MLRRIDADLPLSDGGCVEPVADDVYFFMSSQDSRRLPVLSIALE